MPELTYNGPFPSVHVLLADGEAITAEKGKQVNIPDAKTAESLVAGGDWETTKTKAKE